MTADSGAPAPRRRPWPVRHGRAILAALLGAALFALLLRRAGDLGAVAGVLRGALARPGWLALGAVLFALSLGCGLARWRALLRALRLPVPLADAARLYAAGHCFGVLGPGATGGDVVKAAWFAARTPGRRADAVASIAAERLIGVLALACFVAGVLLARADFFARDPGLAALRRGLLLAFAAVAACAIALAAIDANALARRLRPERGGAAGRAAAAVLRVWGAVRVCLRHPRAAGAAFALSILNFATMVCCWFALSRAAGMALPFRDLAAATPVADAAAALPVTPGGAGLRENLLQRLLDAADVPRAQSTALGLLMFATILLWALLCGAYALSGRRAAAPPLPRNGRP